MTVEVNGTQYSVPEFIPNIHRIEEFKIVFNKLIFETILSPFFDGSREIVVPIRGVNHELAIEDEKTNNEIKGLTAKSTSTTTSPGDLGDNYWAVVFGTGTYDSTLFDDLLYPPMECRSFILGCARSSAPNEFKDGIFDYGWRVAFCMDGSTDQTDIGTCEKTDDDYLKDMLDFANGKLGSSGNLIVFVAGHGVAWTGQHNTVTTKTKFRVVYYTNTLKLTGWRDKMDDITTGGTHVFLWVSACHGWGLDNFQYSHHHDKMESWSFRPVHHGAPSNGYATDEETFGTFCWLYTIQYSNVIPRSECAFFFLGAADGAFVTTVTDIGPDAQSFYNNRFASTMYIQCEWDTYEFYVNRG